MKRSAINKKHSHGVVGQTVCELTDLSTVVMLDYDAGEPRAPWYLPYQSVLCIGGSWTRLDIRAAHVSNGLIRLSDGKIQAPSVSQSRATVCKQVSGCPCVSSPEMCSLSLFRCPGKRFVSVFSSALFQHSRHDGPYKKVLRDPLPAIS